jgi:hypothetical protein
VAEPFLREQGFEPELVEPVLECIEQHHQGGANRRIESILLSDADALDFLGVVGVLRDFSKKPNDLRAAYKTVRTRMEKLPKVICLPKTKEIAAKRLQEMESLLAAFEAESFGCF